MALQTVTTSKKFTLNLNDWWKGLFLAVGIPVLKVIMDVINSGELTFNWLALGKLAIISLIGYLLKNFLTPSKIVISGATPEVVAAVKEGDIDVKVGNTVSTVVPNTPPNNP